MSVAVRDYLKARRDRVVGAILGYSEREIFDSLTPEQQRALRSTVIDAVNMYHDSVLDLVKSDDAVRNDEVVKMLHRVDQHLVRESRSVVLTEG